MCIKELNVLESTIHKAVTSLSVWGRRQLETLPFTQTALVGNRGGGGLRLLLLSDRELSNCSLTR